MTNYRMNLSFRVRQGLTLAEVLVSMGIMTIGLLGVASLFPVGGHYVQQGEVTDTANAIAQAALDDAIIRGHLNPENWLALDIDGAAGLVSSVGDSSVNSCELYPLSASIAESFGKTALGLTEIRYRNCVYGGAYIIDPLGVSSALKEDRANIWQTVRGDGGSEPLRRFPGVSTLGFDSTYASGWDSWVMFNGTWPVRRVTTTIGERLNTSTYDTYEPAARALFTAKDDLALSLPEDADSPARQRLETWQNSSSGTVQPASRQSQGNYSWVISVTPSSSEARDALATQPDAYPYDVSVVVFHKRVLGEGFEGTLEAERLVNAKVVTTGTAGGELLLEKRVASEGSDPYTDFPSPFEELRAGQYVMLTGPHPLSTNNRPMLFNQWYKVQSIEDSGDPAIKDEIQTLDREERVLVSLRGPDWPWQAASDILNEDLLSNDLRVTIVPGAVAVHTKTMRLESGSSWGE